VEWSQLLNLARLNRPEYVERQNRPIYEQDLDRITFSAPFRRLANKTQVHPLYENDHIHHRLIHSVETSVVGRSLGTSVGSWLQESKEIEDGQRHVVSGLVQAACLAHDIGNPPFGHSGEAAIGEWFADKIRKSISLFDELEENRWQEFIEFEGNAQGFRILTRLEMYRNQGGMQLSHGVLGAFTKYPVTAHVKGCDDSNYCGLKKFGVFDSEWEIFSDVANSLGLPVTTNARGSWCRRHPLVFLVEAADDICYNIVDVEDAYVSGDLRFDTVEGVLSHLAGKKNKLCDNQIEKERVEEMRARGIGAAINACVEAFKEHYEQIMDGTFSGSLIEASAKAEEFLEIKKLARSRIFKGHRKTELEVFGRNVIHRVLDGVFPIFEELRDVSWKNDELSAYSKQVVQALGIDLRDATDSYSALHALTDCVSGMTDRYSVKAAEMLAGR